MLLIRRAEAADAAAIAALHAASIREVCSEVYAPAPIEGWASTKHPERYLEPIAQSPFFVAELDSELVGFSQLDIEAAEVRAVFVRPDRLRRGIGRLLLAELEGAASAADLRRIVLRASLNAVRFYESRGFVADATTSICLAPGVELPCVSMHKCLSAGGSQSSV